MGRIYLSSEKRIQKFEAKADEGDRVSEGIRLVEEVCSREVGYRGRKVT